MNDENLPEFQKAAPFSTRVAVNPDNLVIWKRGLVRLFISHRDAHKREAHQLADALEAYGISSFVAHETIEPTREWRKEIMYGLETMEIMLVFLTDDFGESIWTNQEVGFALGRGIPVVSLKLESRDPPGFIGHEQALRGSLADVSASARSLQKLVAEKLGRRERMQAAFVAAFVSSPSWSDTTERFDRMAETVERLSERELTDIIEGFALNDQLHNATYLTSHYGRLVKFLARTTGRKFSIEGTSIREVTARKPPEPEDDIPF
jgi:hypothetical protein